MTMLSPEDRSKIRRYHDALSRQVTPDDVALNDHRFRANHGIEPGSMIAGSLDAILEEHQKRVNGVGCPKDCDDAARVA